MYYIGIKYNQRTELGRDVKNIVLKFPIVIRLLVQELLTKNRVITRLVK